MTPLERAAAVCQNAANSAYECAAKAREAISATKSAEDLNKVLTLWDTRYVSEVARLRESVVGLRRAKSDMELIREALSGQVEDAAKEKIGEAIAKKTIPREWQKIWVSFWSKYLKGVSTFLNHPAAKAALLALKASMPSQIATTFDKMSASNKSVHDAWWERARILNPPPSFIETIRSDAYEKVNKALGPRLEPGPTLTRP